jgi:uncharacterized membrane protein (UPF0127 family)
MRKEGKMFFSEEKNQKTLNSPLPPPSPAKSRMFKLAQTQKSFGSFLQKRTFFLCLVLACGPARAVDGPQPELPTQKVTIIGKSGVRHVFTVEIAGTPEQQEIGEMYRTNIPADRGMFFDWGTPRDVPMWMKNCPVPEDMVFISQDGTIAHIAENTVPYSEANIDPGSAVRATLELQGGITAKLGIEVGDRVSGVIFAP